VDVEAAKKEGQLILYGTVPTRSMTVVNKAFEKKYGIRVDYWRAASSKVLDRALTEWRADRPRFDVIESTRGTQLIMRQEGFYTPFRPAPAGKFPFLEKDGLLTPWRAVPFSILYNTDLLKPVEAPKNFADLLAPKWKKRIAISDASRHTTTAEFFSNMDKYFGDKAGEWIQDLARQEPHLVVSLLPVGRAIVSGEAPVGITYIKYVNQVKGPLDYVRLDKYLAGANYFALSKKAAHPNAGKLYIEFITSPDGQKLIAKQGEFVLSPGVDPAIDGAAKIKESMVLMDVPTAEQFKMLKEKYRKLFYKK
jgi:iron(III) transport system substrate-binding protein